MIMVDLCLLSNGNWTELTHDPSMTQMSTKYCLFFSEISAVIWPLQLSIPPQE